MSTIAHRPAAALALAGAALLMSAALLWASPVRAVELDTFLAGLDECSLPPRGGPFGAFATSLFQRYSNRPGNPNGRAADRAHVQIVVPPELEATFGPPATRNFGEYTVVTVPVMNGTFGGLPLDSLAFRFGNQNAIKALAIVFAASHADVVTVFGDAVEQGDDRGQTAGRSGPGYSAEIPPGEPGHITCDWSS